MLTARRFLAIALALNLPFALCHPDWPLVSQPLIRSLAINSVLFVVPGLAVVSAFTSLGWLRRWHLLWVVAASLVVFVLGVLITIGLGGGVNPGAPWNLAWAVTNAGVLVSWRLGRSATIWPAADPAVWRVFLPIAIGAYLLFLWGAVTVVPPMGDHDIEVQGTAHALLTEGRPAYPTHRSFYYFAHPPLLHVYAAASFLYYGRADELAVYNPHRPAVVASDQLPGYYWSHPFFLETRTPNVFMSAMTVALLALWVVRTTGRVWFAMLMAAAYATLPEVFVRSSYGGYFPGSHFFALQVLFAAEDWRRDGGTSRWRAGLSGGLAALANHKLAVPVVAIALWNAGTTVRQRGLQSIGRAIFHPVVVGFGLGTLAFWAYGWSISPTDFWNDHIRQHIVERVTNQAPIQPGKYPTVPALWLEFWRDTSYLLLPVGIGSLAVFLAGRASKSAAPQIGGGVFGLPGLWSTWVLVAAVVFSLVDWKMTKHLTVLFLPLMFASAGASTSSRTALRLVAVSCALMLIWNVAVLRMLSLDFTSLVKAPEW